MDRTTDVLMHLPRSISGLAFLLKNLCFLHGIHLLKFMMEKKVFLQKKRERKREREKKTTKYKSGTGSQGGGGDRVREKSERGSRGVRALIEYPESVYVGELGRVVRCDITHTHSLNRRVRKGSDKSRDRQLNNT